VAKTSPMQIANLTELQSIITRARRTRWTATRRLRTAVAIVAVR